VNQDRVSKWRTPYTTKATRSLHKRLGASFLRKRAPLASADVPREVVLESISHSKEFAKEFFAKHQSISDLLKYTENPSNLFEFPSVTPAVVARMTLFFEACADLLTP
jgi:hypothetical protein